ncbi:MAG: hypothetical protein J0L92_07925 [Deltaproteobacteria bacterium]|nr:hypothetical protein [Deltaproteobacteria bacterium]
MLTIATIGIALVALVSSAWSSPTEAQRRATRRRTPRVIVLDEMDCDMGRWPEPHFVPIAPEPECALGALMQACGAPAPATCPEDAAALDRALFASCDVGRDALVALTYSMDREGMPPPVEALVDRFGAFVDDVHGDVDRVLLLEILRRASRYAPAVTLATRLIDEARDPAIRELARDRLVAMLEYDDWDENGVTDVDFATHVQVPSLADRPWALGVARRVLARVGCATPRERIEAALRARFGVDVEPQVERTLIDGPLGDMDPIVLRQRVRALPLVSCAPEPESAIAYLRVQEDGSVEGASTSVCLTSLLTRLRPIVPAPAGGAVEARFVLVFAASR